MMDEATVRGRHFNPATLDDDTIEKVAIQAGPYAGVYLEGMMQRLYREYWFMPRPDKSVLLRALLDQCDVTLPKQELIEACVLATLCQYLVASKLDARA